MVVRSLKDVAQEFVFKEGDRQLHQFDEIVGNEGNVHTRGDVHKQPVAHHVENHDRNEDADVAHQHHIDEIDVGCFDAHVNNGLGDERQDALQQGDDEHHSEDKNKLRPVGSKIAKNGEKISLISWISSVVS